MRTAKYSEDASVAYNGLVVPFSMMLSPSTLIRVRSSSVELPAVSGIICFHDVKFVSEALTIRCRKALEEISSWPGRLKLPGERGLPNLH